MKNFCKDNNFAKGILEMAVNNFKNVLKTPPKKTKELKKTRETAPSQTALPTRTNKFATELKLFSM